MSVCAAVYLSESHFFGARRVCVCVRNIYVLVFDLTVHKPISCIAYSSCALVFMFIFVLEVEPTVIME